MTRRVSQPSTRCLRSAPDTGTTGAAGPVGELVRSRPPAAQVTPPHPARDPATASRPVLANTGISRTGAADGTVEVIEHLQSRAETWSEVPRTFRTVHRLGWTTWKGKVLPRPNKSFSPEFKDEAVKMVIETSRPIARVAKELGINEGTLGNWVSIYRREHAGEEPPLTVSERARLRELERETRELKMENEFLKKAGVPRAREAA